MRLALVTLDYPPERGGVARYLGNLVQASGGAVDVYVNDTHQANGPGKVHSARLLQTSWPQWWPMVLFIKRLRRKSYDHVLISHALPVGTAAMLARLMGGPAYSVLVHGLDLRIAMLSRRKTWLFRQVLRRASCVIANSAFVAGEIRSLEPRVHPHVLTPGVESMSFPSKSDARQSCGIRNDIFLLLSVTRLVSRKGLDRALEVLARLSNTVRLAIVGDGEDQHRLAQMARDLGVTDRVIFVTRATDTERNAWYAAADVFVLPVRDEGRDVEGFGIVYLEAALAGLPVIAGRSGGAPEALVDGKTGRLVDPSSVEDLETAIRSLMEDAALRSRMGEAGSVRARTEFRWEDRWERLRSWL